MGLPEADLAIIGKALEFATWKEIASTTQVEEHFGSLRRRPEKFNTIPVGDARPYRNDQAQLRRWLEAYINSEGTTAAATEIAKVFGDTFVMDGRLEKKRDQLRIVPVYRLHDVRGCYSLAVALVLHHEAAHRLGHCKECKRYFFDEREGKSGRRRTEFCSPAHANVYKVRKFRKRHKKEE